MSRRNVFENMGTGFPVFFRYQKSMTISWHTKKSKTEMPWNFLTVNINLHFRRWRLNFGPFDAWLLTTLRPSQKRTDLKVSLHASHSKDFSSAGNSSAWSSVRSYFTLRFLRLLGHLFLTFFPSRLTYGNYIGKTCCHLFKGLWHASAHVRQLDFSPADSFSRLAFGEEILFHRPWDARESHNISIQELFGPFGKF